MRRNEFKDRMVNRCYNCLALDHRCAQCRDPTRCWKCKRSGHISSHCNLTAFVNNDLKKVVTMERRLSFGRVATVEEATMPLEGSTVALWSSQW
jgi:hypothetical protein